MGPLPNSTHIGAKILVGTGAGGSMGLVAVIICLRAMMCRVGAGWVGGMGMAGGIQG
jgi:hypothetical protein